MKWISFLWAACLNTACLSGTAPWPEGKNNSTGEPDTISPKINPVGNTVETRFPVPAGFVRAATDSGSFAAYLRGLPLHSDGHPVHLYDGRIKPRADVYCAVLNLDIGNRDLQQCADAVIRLRAEYLYRQKRYTDIHFRFTSGFVAAYTRWRGGERIRLDGNRAYWVPGAALSSTYSEFRKYLDVVFMYAGTASLERELIPAKPESLRPGDIWIEGGSPGHAVIVLDVVQNPGSGEHLFLLAQSYMPAQEIHVLANPAHTAGDPWYNLAEIGEYLETPQWQFRKDQLRRFPAD